MPQKEINIQNKKARFEYHILEQYTGGIQLKGTEIKSIRNGKASIMEAYGIVDRGEVYIRNMYISEYEKEAIIIISLERIENYF